MGLIGVLHMLIRQRTIRDLRLLMICFFQVFFDLPLKTETGTRRQELDMIVFFLASTSRSFFFSFLFFFFPWTESIAWMGCWVFYDKLFSFQDTTQTPYEIQSSFKLGLGIHSTCAWQGLEAIKWIIAVPSDLGDFLKFIFI